MVKRDDELRCSFCGKTQSEVEKLIAGQMDISREVFICNECIDICNEIVADDREMKEQTSNPTLMNEGEKPMSSKEESANLILRLYELRREEKMRAARQWFSRFDPQSGQDIMNAMMNEESSAYFRMVTSYWDMAASLVNNGAIDSQMFDEANGEHVFVFAKIQPLLAEMRKMFDSPQALANLERYVLSLPDAQERLDKMRERFKRMAAMRGETKAQEAAAT